MSEKTNINWWRTEIGSAEIESVVLAMQNECISQGKITQKFECLLAEYLEVEHVVAVSNGSSALLLALMAVGVKPGDEVIVPNRTWIATAHAVHLLGAKVVLVDVESHRPIIDITKIEAVITAKTKAIIPVHMNGRSVDMIGLKRLAKKHQLFIIEDAAQAFSSKNSRGFLGTQSDVGCFSLSMAKIMATGQGGFAVTNNANLANKLRAIRTHGVENVKDPQQWQMVGFNFRYTDIQAAIGIEQLKKIPSRKAHLIDIYQQYEQGLRTSPLTLIPADIEQGEVPIYAEFLVPNRNEWINRLSENNIETRPFYPCINKADYFDYFDINFPNAQLYGDQGLYLPSGPAQSIENIKQVIKTVNSVEL